MSLQHLLEMDTEASAGRLVTSGVSQLNDGRCKGRIVESLSLSYDPHVLHHNSVISASFRNV